MCVLIVFGTSNHAVTRWFEEGSGECVTKILQAIPSPTPDEPEPKNILARQGGSEVECKNRVPPICSDDMVAVVRGPHKVKFIQMMTTVASRQATAELAPGEERVHKIAGITEGNGWMRSA